MKLLCCDPGKLSGLSILELEDNKVEILETTELEQYDTCEWILDRFDSIDKVVCEDFIISPRTGKMKTSDTRFSLEIIGFIRYLCVKNKKPLILQTPAHMKSFFANWSLRDFGLWSKGGEGHKRDSIRHGVVYLLGNNKWNPGNIEPTKGDYENLKEHLSAGTTHLR